MSDRYYSSNKHYHKSRKDERRRDNSSDTYYSRSEKHRRREEDRSMKRGYGRKEYRSKEDGRREYKHDRQSSYKSKPMRREERERSATYPRDLSPFQPRHVKVGTARDRQRDEREKRNKKAHRYSISPIRKRSRRDTVSRKSTVSREASVVWERTVPREDTVATTVPEAGREREDTKMNEEDQRELDHSQHQLDSSSSSALHDSAFEDDDEMRSRSTSPGDVKAKKSEIISGGELKESSPSPTSMLDCGSAVLQVLHESPDQKELQQAEKLQLLEHTTLPRRTVQMSEGGLVIRISRS